MPRGQPSFRGGHRSNGDAATRGANLPRNLAATMYGTVKTEGWLGGSKTARCQRMVASKFRGCFDLWTGSGRRCIPPEHHVSRLLLPQSGDDVPLRDALRSGSWIAMASSSVLDPHPTTTMPTPPCSYPLGNNFLFSCIFHGFAWPRASR